MPVWRRALQLTPQGIVDAVTESGLRGRGGAAFPAGIKWQTVLDTPAAQKYIVCNADEGDSGTFADRLLMEADPYQLIEGMVIAGLAVGASHGYIYLRSEYPRALEVLNAAIDRARSDGYLGDDIRGSGHSFELEVRLGAGAYICGEETALLDSLEGRRGVVRVKPPLPAIAGLFGQPTVVNNVLTLAAVTTVLARGARPITGIRRGALPRHPDAATGGQYPSRRSGGAALWRQPAPGDGGLWRRHLQRPPHQGYPGGWSPGRLSAAMPSGIPRWITRPLPRSARCWGTAAWWCLMTRWIWAPRRALPWSSARRNPAASARPAASAPPGVWK